MRGVRVQITIPYRDKERLYNLGILQTPKHIKEFCENAIYEKILDMEANKKANF